eukprot:m.73392 g.73392  ORF g.73392 m.73392 type:complete len:112 (+) comp12367_c0_seq2:1867-2202(+)
MSCMQGTQPGTRRSAHRSCVVCAWLHFPLQLHNRIKEEAEEERVEVSVSAAGEGGRGGAVESQQRGNKRKRKKSPNFRPICVAVQEIDCVQTRELNGGGVCSTEQVTVYAR